MPECKDAVMIKYHTEKDAINALIESQGEDFAQYRRKWDQANNFELEPDFPLFLHIEPSYKCNFRCTMCVQGIPELKEKFGYSERMTTGEIIKILEEGRKYNCPSISFQGDNEPFLIREITDWFALAKDYGFLDIMVNTNGSVMNDKIAEKIIRSGLTRIRFSLDAVTEVTYSKIRIGGKYRNIIANIELFLRKRKELISDLPKVGVNFVRMKENKHELEDFILFWNNKVDYLVIQDFMSPDVEGDYSYGAEGMSGQGKSVFKCTQPWQRLYIRGNGEVTPCCAMFSLYLKLGDIASDSLYELWNSKAAKELRRLHAEGRYAENYVCLKCSKSGQTL